MLTLPMREGSISGLKDPYSILLSESLAKALFANSNPLGQILKMDDSLSIKVTGVYKDFPYNSSFRDITFLSPWDLYESFDPETRHNRRSWDENNWQVFVQLEEHADLDKVSASIKNIKADNNPWPDAKGQNLNTTELFLHPMSRWHLYSEFRDGESPSGRIRYVKLFGLIGILVLILACINFMNLSTAPLRKAG